MVRVKGLAVAALLLFFTLTGCVVEQGKVSPQPKPPPPPAVEAPKGPTASFCLLPQADGRTGSVVVTAPKGTRTLTGANMMVSVQGADAAPGQPRTLSGDEVDKLYGEALKALPPPPAHFILYFERDKPELTEASKPLVEQIAAAIKERVGADISIIGHTDTTGDRVYNYKLGLARAKAMAELLTARGLDLSAAQTSSHGQDNQLVPTGPNVDEPKNRRVEISVR